MCSKIEYQNAKKKAKDALMLNRVLPDAFKQSGSSKRGLKLTRSETYAKENRAD